MSTDRKVKVWNRSQGNHGIRFMDGIRSINLPPGGFIYLPLEEVYYIYSSSKSFQKGILEIDPNETELRQELGLEVRNPNTITEAEIRELLTGHFTQANKDKLSQITERHAKERIINVARSMQDNLTVAKVKFIEELTGMKVQSVLDEK